MCKIIYMKKMNDKKVQRSFQTVKGRISSVNMQATLLFCLWLLAGNRCEELHISGMNEIPLAKYQFKQ